MHTSFKVKRSKVKVTRPTNAETERVSYVPNGKAYKVQTWYTDASRRPLSQTRLLIFHHYTKFGARILIYAQIMVQKRNSKWQLLTYFLRCTTELNLRSKFHANISIHDWIITFWNSWWWPSNIMDFRKPDHWPGLLILHYGIKFDAKMLIDAQIMAQKRNSEWRPPPSWIYFRWLFLTYCQLYTVSLNDRIKFHAKYLNLRLNYNKFLKFKFELLHHHISPPIKLKLHGAASPCQILCQSDAEFWRCGDLIFLQNWLEMPVHPKILVFGDLDP